MNPQQFLRFTTLSVGLLAVVGRAQAQTPKFAILNLPSGVYLQMDVSGLSGSEEPKFEKIRVSYTDGISYTDDGLAQAKAALSVEWSMVPVTVVSEAKITDAQVIKKIDLPLLSSCPKCNDTLRALRVDTITFYSSMASSTWRQIAPPHVNALSLTPRVHCAVKYAAPSCLGEKGGCRDMFIKQFVEVWKVKPYASILDRYQFSTWAAVSPWSQTNGTEEVEGIVVPRPGNASNWIDMERIPLATRSILKPSIAPIQSSDLIIKALPIWSIPTGAVRYVYNRTASPELKILETGDHRTVGNILKIGSTVDVSRTARPNGCLPPRPDSTMGSSSWLVLADSASESAMEQAMELNDNPFGPPRASAWKISGDTVWLDGSTKIPLADLLAAAQGTTGVQPNVLAAGCRLARTSDGFALVLDREAEARVVGADGQILSDWKHLPVGRHALPQTPLGVSFAQIRGKGIHATLSILR